MKKEICDKICPEHVHEEQDKCIWACGIDTCCLECTLKKKNKHSPLVCTIKDDFQGILFKYVLLKAKYKKSGGIENEKRDIVKEDAADDTR